MLHKCIFEILRTNNFGVRFFLQFVLEVDVRFFLINQSDYGNKPTYLSVSKIVSPIFLLELQFGKILFKKCKLMRITSQVFFKMDLYVITENHLGPTDLVQYSLSNVN